MRIKAKIAVLVMALAVVCQGCGIYSFSGASIPAEAKTVSVDYFPNHARLQDHPGGHHGADCRHEPPYHHGKSQVQQPHR